MAIFSKTLLPVLLSGLLFALSLPPFNIEWLGWGAFVPLLLAANGRRPLEAFGLGMLAGAFCGVVSAGWYHDTARLFWAYIPFLWLAFLFGTVALASASAAKLESPLARVLFVASVGVGSEWLTSFLPLPLNIALCQYRNITLIQIASFTGIWGISLLLWAVNAALAEAVRRRNLLPLGVSVSLVVVSLGYGLFQTSQTESAHVPKITVAAIQDLVGQEAGDLAPVPPGTVDRTQMTKNAAGRGAKLIVWSEESLGGEFDPASPKDETRLLARSLKTALVVGYSDDAKPKPFNCAALIAPTGDVLMPVHHKVHLYLADSNGLSQIVDAHGRILAQSPLYAPDVLVATVPLGSGKGTFFTRWGDWLAYGCLAGAVAGFAGTRKRKR